MRSWPVTWTRIALVAMILPLILTAPRARCEDADVEALLSRMSQAIEDLDAMQGTFRQEVEMTLMGETRNYSGRIYYMNPDLLRLEYDSPSGQLLICDGDSFWMYLTDGQRPQAFKTPVGEEIGGFVSPATLKVLEDRYDSRLEPEEVVDGVPCYQIVFTPNVDNLTARFQSLRLWIGKDDLVSKRLSYQDMAGNQITYSFYDWIKLHALPGELFSFTPSPEMDLFENP